MLLLVNNGHLDTNHSGESANVSQSLTALCFLCLPTLLTGNPKLFSTGPFAVIESRWAQ